MGFIGVGVGGWTFPPWRGVFYPKGLRQAGELEFASGALTALEINATYHSLHRPEDFARWASQTPPAFRFAVKASRFCTNRRVLAEAGEAVDRFFSQGLAELGDRLGPILWQFMPTKRFDREDFARFLDLLPGETGGLRVRHAVEVRNESFAVQSFADLCRERDVAICLADHPTYPLIDEDTSSFSYARLMRLNESLETGYSGEELDAWAKRLEARSAQTEARKGREVFAFFIGAGGEGKLRAPAAALGLIGRLAAR